MWQHRRAIWWIKRDFRLHDNEQLIQALRQSQTVLPVFVFEPLVINSPETSPLHLQAQMTALLSLKSLLQQLGANVCVLTDDLPNAFTRLHQEYSFEAIYSHQETGSMVTYKRDLLVKQWCKDHAIDWIEVPQNAVVRGRIIDKLDKKAWEKFMHTKQATAPTSFPWNDAMEKLCQKSLPSFPLHISRDKLQPVTEAAAHRVLDSFFQTRGLSYWGSISSPNTAWTHGSRLSPHLAWGTLSLRQVFQKTQHMIQKYSDHPNQQWLKSLHAFSSRLYWHDHFMQKLESYPNLEYVVSDKRYKDMYYEDNKAYLEMWLHGNTGFPMVDATMRCLSQTGFVNFRMRAMAISFAAFGLHLSWRTTMHPFARLMADYEPGIHIYQVQMQSGVTKGPAMRVYNPLKQMIDKDAACDFIKKWIPELRPFTPAQIYGSILQSEMYGIGAGEQLGKYQKPIIHWKQRNAEMKEQLMNCRRRKSEKSKPQMLFTF